MKKYMGEYALELCSIDGYRRKRKRKKKTSSKEMYEQITSK